MTIPANLFVDSPEMEDVALTHLNNDATTWPEEIVQKFRERVPQSQNMGTMVKFMKKDDENGSATGSIVVNSADKAVVIPVIIKEFMMYPLDIMIAKGKLLPLTQDYFDSAFSKNEVFDRLEEFPTYGGLGRFEDANLWNAIYPPSLGRYAYASAGYPIMDAISDKLDGTPLKEWLLANPEYAVNFHKHGQTEAIKKIANMKPVNMNEFRPGKDNLIPKNISMLRYDGPNKYSLLSSNDKVFSPAITKKNREEACRYVSEISDDVEDTMNEVDQNGEKMLLLPQPKDDVFLARSDDEVPEEANEFDTFAVKTKTGVTVVGCVIPKVIGFEQDPVDLKIFLGKTFQTIQPDIWGVRVQNANFRITGTCPQIGQTGTFVFQADKSHALATVPVTIKSVVNDVGSLILVVYDLMGKPYKLKCNPELGLQRIGKLPDGSYLIPKEMKWVVMEGFGPVSNSAESYAVKTAGAKLTDRPVVLIATGYDQYALKGVDKYAVAANMDKTNLARSEAKFILASLGCSEQKIASFLKQASRSGHAEIHNLNFIPLTSEKIAEYRPKAAKLMKIAKDLKSNLFKEASYIDNAQTVDAILSLNFISPDNISKFVGKIPQLKAAISSLASCLIASRIGMKEIPEQAASTSMHRMVEVVGGLEKLRATQEVNPEG
jgi:hypothetical protein